ncbi:hypothetical protein RCC89_11800 [Cytophagaceae bacterium ABcell3]|nr:hypothetical protein RCC89_11800 [Cytophagaceae bacterium ABcell3]
MIKKNILKLKNFLAKRQNKTRRHTVKWEEATQIGVLVDNPDGSQIKAVNKFIEELRSEKKEVEVICRIEKSYLRNYSFDFIQVSSSSLDWKGTFKDIRINNFTKKKFDYLYSINNSPFLPFENILVSSKANFRIGINNGRNLDLFEIAIQPHEHEKLGDILNKMLTISKKLTN